MNAYQEEIDSMEKKLKMVKGFTPEQVLGAKRLFIHMIELNIKNYNRLNKLNDQLWEMQATIDNLQPTVVEEEQPRELTEYERKGLATDGAIKD